MDLRIGIKQTNQTVEVSLKEKETLKSVKEKLAAAVNNSELLWLTDKEGNEVALSGDQVSFIEIRSTDTHKKIGFGA